MPHRSTDPLPVDSLSAAEQATFDPRNARYRVEVLSGNARGQSAELESLLVIGAGDDVQLKVTDGTVSRRHAELERRAEGVWVKDLASKNGTWFHGARVDGFLVRREAVFSLGTVLCRLYAIPSGDAESSTSFGEVFGQAPPMKELFLALRRAAPTLSTVLLRGETGTGKELLARAIHQHSPRRHRPFVVVDCGALSPTLAESELFGHVRGAFTGAHVTRDGAFMQADGGTLFLDEIGELPLDLQPKLLRALESRTVRRVGDTVDAQLDVRVLAATHRDLLAEVRAGRFREDLYFRLAVVVAQVPPLRERLEDLPLLVTAILTRAGRPQFELPVGLLARLGQHHWPGNVRELRNVIERAVSAGTESLDEKLVVSVPQPYKQAKEQLIEDFTREYFTRLHHQCGGNVAEMAKLAGIARTYAHELVAKFGLKS